VLAATQGTDPQVAFQLLRARARASSRKLADVAREVVQDAQRQRLAALTQRRALLDQAQIAADERDRVANERDRTAGHPD
jgi:hypothetical protein